MPDRKVVVYSIAPDFCTMPDGSVVPFDLFATYRDSQKESSTVFSNGYGTSHIDACLMMCTGDESAVGGVKSGAVAGPVEMLPNSCTVNVNGKQAMRDSDFASMNYQNTIGVIKVLAEGTIGEVGQNVHENKKQIAKYKKAKKKLANNKSRTFKNENIRKQSNSAFKRQMNKATSKMKSPIPGAKNLPVATGVLRHAPTAMMAYSAYESGKALYDGDNKEALKKASSASVGFGVGAAGTATCGALTVSGIGTLAGFACFALVAVGSYASASATEELVEEYVPEF